MSQIYNVYSLRDMKGEFYGSPYLARNHALATRLFAQCLRTPDFPCAQAPSDFALFYLGNFDDACGHFDNVTPQLVITGNDLISELTRGAAVGGETPLKQQSDIKVSSRDAESENTSPACDHELTSSSKAENEVSE